LIEIIEIDGDTIPDGTQIIDVIGGKYLIFQKSSWYWISQNLNLFRVNRVAVSLHMLVISD
jgi:hypothetical protein